MGELSLLCCLSFVWRKGCHHHATQHNTNRGVDNTNEHTSISLIHLVPSPPPSPFPSAPLALLLVPLMLCYCLVFLFLSDLQPISCSCPHHRLDRPPLDSSDIQTDRRDRRIQPTIIANKPPQTRRTSVTEAETGSSKTGSHRETAQQTRWWGHPRRKGRR